MKKLFTVIIFISFIGNVSALDIEARLTETKKNIIALENKVTTFENTRLNKTYPVGSIFKTTTYSNVSQVQAAVGGIWEVYGTGRTLIGVNTSDATFNSASKTGGSNVTTLSVSNIPSHTHPIPVLSGTTSEYSHGHAVYIYYDQSGYNQTIPAYTTYVRFGTVGYTSTTAQSNKNSMKQNSIWSSESGAHSHTFSTNRSTTGSSGSTSSFTNLGPYITVYMYKRIA